MGTPKPTRKPSKPAGRALRVLRRLAAFISERGYPPTVPELTAVVGRGSRWTVWRDCTALRHAGLVRIKRRCWLLTPMGYEELCLPPVTPRHDRRPRPQTAKQKRDKERAQRTLRHRAAVEIFERPKTAAAPWAQPEEQADDDLPVVY